MMLYIIYNLIKNLVSHSFILLSIFIILKIISNIMMTIDLLSYSNIIHNKFTNDDKYLDNEIIHYSNKPFNRFNENREYN